jgi:hypothetical protein
MTLYPARFTVGKRIYGAKRGLNLLTIDYEGEFHLENFDTWDNSEDAARFIERIRKLQAEQKFWALCTCDATRNYFPGYQQGLRQAGFQVLPKLNGRAAYIAYSTLDNQIHEKYTGVSTLHYIIPSFLRLNASDRKARAEKKRRDRLAVQAYRKDPKRFIAHAGGAIDGYIYTDSLEALDTNYGKGFRLFELDIIKTSDDIYVAAHDWKSWSQQSGFQGKLPVDRATFKKYKLHNRFTPLDMDDINRWFSSHPDAILVTDKINTPADFAAHFVDRKRLMMELFSWEAVKEGLAAGIKSAMPTGDILWLVKDDPVSYLKELGVTDIALSRHMLRKQEPLLRTLSRAGFHLYAFNINYDPGIDEKYVVCHERQYFYGIYADHWDFNTPLECAEK